MFEIIVKIIENAREIIQFQQKLSKNEVKVNELRLKYSKNSKQCKNL